MAYRRLASHCPFPEPHSLFPEHQCFHTALAKLPSQRRRSSWLHSSWQRKSSAFFGKMAIFLSIALFYCEGCGFTRYQLRVLKAFFKPCIVSIWEAVTVTRKVKLSPLMQAACHYDLLFLMHVSRIIENTNTNIHRIGILIKKYDSFSYFKHGAGLKWPPIH